jgi:hypothetical protein
MILFRYLCIALLGLAGAGTAYATDAEDCTALPHLQCLESSTCVVQRAPGYGCRAAANICEARFRQNNVSTAGQAACVSSGECRLIPGHCYCPPYPGLRCVCGGGDPPQCVPR